MVGKLFRLAAHHAFRVHGLGPLGHGHKALSSACLERAAACQRVGFIRNPSARNGLAVNAVALVVVDRCNRRVNRNLVKVRTAKTRQLGVEIRMVAPHQQRVVCEIDARNNVLRAKCHLLGFSKEVVGVAVQYHPANRLDRNEFFGNQFGGIQNVEAELLGLRFGKNLHAQFPFRIGTRLDTLPQIATVEIRISAGNLHRFVPHQRMRAGCRIPVEFDIYRFPRVIDKTKGVNAKALHGGKAAGNRAVRHLPHQHVGGFRHQGHEIPESVVRAGGLRHLVVRLGLDGMHQVRKLDRILNEEHRHVVAHNVPVALIGIKLDGKPAHVARGVFRAAFAGHGGKSHEHRCDLAGFLERRRLGVLGQRLVAFEIAVRTGTPRMHDTFWNALMVKVRHLLAKDEVFKQRRPTQAKLERILVVRNTHAHVGGQHLSRRIHAHAVQRLDGSIHAFGRNAAGLVAAVLFGQGATGGQPGLGLGCGALLRRAGTGKSMLGGLVRVKRHGRHQGFGLGHFFSHRVAA